MTKTEHDILATGLEHLRHGLSIIPINASGSRAGKPHFEALHRTGHSKSQLRQSGMVQVPTWAEFEHKRASVKEVTDWVRQYGVTAFGVLTGQLSGFVIIEFARDAERWLDRLGWQAHVLMPQGGAQVYLKHPGYHVHGVRQGPGTAAALSLPPGVSIRGDAAYTVLPPAVLDPAGQYRRTPLRPFLPLEEVPDLLNDLEDTREFQFKRALGLVAPTLSNAQGSAVSAAVTATPPVPGTPVSPFGGGGYGRHATLERRPPPPALLAGAERKAWRGDGRASSAMWFAAQMRDSSYSQGECEAAYDALNRVFPNTDGKGRVTPFTRDEFRSTVFRVYRRAARQSPEDYRQSLGRGQADAGIIGARS